MNQGPHWLPIGQLARTNVLLILIFTSVFILLALKMFLPIRFFSIDIFINSSVISLVVVVVVGPRSGACPMSVPCLVVKLVNKEIKPNT